MRIPTLVALLILVFVKVQASPELLTYQGRILKADGTPLEYGSVSFLFEITNSADNCVLYREQVDGVNMASSKGVFDVPIGGGTKMFPTTSTSLLNIFDNTQKLDCANASNVDVGDYTPSAGDTRLLKVQFHDGVAWNVLSSSSEIRSVPFAAFAQSAQKLGNKSASDFMAKTDFAGYVASAACSTNQTMYWNSTNDKFECQTISATLAGDVMGAIGTSKVVALQSFPVGTASPTNNQVLTWTGGQWAPADLPTQSSGTVTGVTSANSDIGVSVSSPNPVLTLNAGTSGGAGDASKIAKLDVSGLLAVNMIPAISANKITSGTLGLANGGTGATTDVAARSNLGLGTAATKDTGTASGDLPVLGVAGIAANKMCTSDSSSGLICNMPIPTGTQWATSGSDISYMAGNVGVGTVSPTAKLEVAGTLKIVDGNQGLNKVLTSDANGVASWQNAVAATAANVTSIIQARAATTANITLSGLQTIDGVALAESDRVLVLNQSSWQNNGVYLASSGSWTRTTDFDTWAEVVGAIVQIREGNNWRESLFLSAVATGGTLGSTGISFSAINPGVNSKNNFSVGTGAFVNTSGEYNSAVGIQALNNIQTGTYNTAVGYSALRSLTSSHGNVAVGYNSLSGSPASYNTAVGYESLRFNSGGNNVAFGNRALSSNSSAGYNSAFGTQALMSNTTGAYNLAVGGNSMQYSVTGAGNVALGVSTLLYNVGKSESTAVGYNSMVYADSATANTVTYNTALGAYSLYGSTTAANNTGTQNTALGHSALRIMTSGSGNIGVGYNAGSSITTGSNNVIIGSHTGASIATSSNNIIIADGAGTERILVNSSGNVGVGLSPGYKLDVNGDINIAAASALLFGGTQVCTSAGCTSPSDKRLKENILPLENSLEKILQLQGVEYDYRNKGKFGDKHQIGVIAQEVEKVFPEVVLTDENTGFKSVAYDHLVAPLVEAVKALYNRTVNVEAQQTKLNRQVASKADKADTDAKIKSLETENALLKARLEKLEKVLNAK